MNQSEINQSEINQKWINQKSINQKSIRNKSEINQSGQLTNSHTYLYIYIHSPTPPTSHPTATGIHLVSTPANPLCQYAGCLHLSHLGSTVGMYLAPPQHPDGASVHLAHPPQHFPTHSMICICVRLFDAFLGQIAQMCVCWVFEQTRPWPDSNSADSKACAFSSHVPSVHTFSPCQKRTFIPKYVKRVTRTISYYPYECVSPIPLQYPTRGFR